MINSVKLLKLGPSFFRVEDAITKRCFSITSGAYKGYISNLTVIGAGHMGTGIAQNAGLVGNTVIIADTNEGSLAKSRNKIEDRIVRISQRKMKGKSEDEIKNSVDKILEQFQWTTDISSAVSHSDLIIESIPEQIDLKHKLFAELDKVARPEAIFTTNTSSIPVSEIAQPVSFERKQRFGGTHFFDRDVKLVEIIRIRETTDDTYHKLKEWATYIEKVPIICKDTPGFIVNRLNLPYFINAVNMYERGDAEMRDIDTAMKLGAGYPFGPFELADHIGLDVLHDIIQGWQKRYPDLQQYKCPSIITRLCNEGKFGRKTGEGFFKYF